MSDISLWTAMEMLRIKRDLDRKLARLCEDFGATPPPSLEPSMIMDQEDHTMVVTLELPGVDTDDLSVDVDGDVLMVTYRHEESLRGQSSVTTRTARLKLPRRVDEARASASHEDGTLRIVLPMAAKPHSLSIATGRSG